MVLKKCSICDRRFTKTEHCKRHERSHTRQKPYECDVCHKRYSRSDVLCRHAKGHKAKASAATNQILPSSAEQDDETALSPHATMADYRRMSMQHIGQPVSRENGNHVRLNSYHGQSLERLPIQGDGNDPLGRTSSLSGLQTNANMNAMSPTGGQQVIPSAAVAVHDFSIDFSMDDSQQNGNMSHSLPYESALGAHPNQPSYNITGANQGTVSNNGDLDELLQSWLIRPESEGRSQSGSFDLTRAGIFAFGEDHMTSRQDARLSNGAKLGDNIPNERFARVEQCWLTRPSNVSRLIRTLWWDVIHTDVDNIFSEAHVPSSESQYIQNQGSRRGVDEECRIRLQNAFGTQAFSWGQSAQFSTSSPGQLSGNSPGFPDQTAIGIETNLGQLSANSFPPAEILDMSLDLYFRHFHPLIPFIHAPTYCAKATPLPLLFTQCLIGLVILGTTGATTFASKAFPLTLARMSADMTTAALGSGTPGSILSTFAAAFLMLNLALLTGERENLEQCQMLYVNLISVAQRHGLFTDNEGHSLDTNQLESISDLDQRWKAWSRVESTKRLRAGLLIIDTFFAAFLYTSPIIHPDSVHIHLLCDDVLFQATSAQRWLQLTQSGHGVMAPILDSTSGSMSFPSPPMSSDAFSTCTIFSTIQLRICEAYHRLFGGVERQPTQQQLLVPWQAYESDSRACVIAPLVIEVVNVYGHLFGSMNPNCLTLWHRMCIMLTADVRIFELAAGRAGAMPARKALDDIAAWSQTPAARRACIHAAQTFRLMANRKASDGITFQSATALFTSALILGLFVFMLPPDGPHNGNAEPIELMNDVDWKRLGNVGLTTESTAHSPTPMDLDPATNFILNGGTICISGIPHQPGYQSARQVLLDYGSLLKEVGKRSMRKFSRVLLIMSDVLMDVDGHGQDEGL